MPATAPTVHTKAADATRDIGVDFSGQLNSGVELTGTPEVTAEVYDAGSVDGPDDLEITSPQTNSTARVINNKSVTADHAVLFRCAGGSAGVRYKITISCAGDNGETFVGIIYLDVD